MIKTLGGRLHKVVAGLILVTFSACSSLSHVQQVQYDTLIVNGRVLDGTGNPWYHADIAIRGNQIVKIGKLRDHSARDTIDAEGLYVAPGFIDVHSHAGSGLTKPELSGAEPLLRQGITTVFVNPDGGGEVDIEEQRKDLLKDGLGVNVAQLVPHGSVRGAVLGMDDRAPSAEELERMKQLVRKGMRAGAFGLSSGPFYAPGSYSTTDELIELAKVASEFGGVYTSHIRDESNYTIGLEAAVDEVIQIAREAKLRGIATHIKALGPPVWGLSGTIVENIERAREEGVEVFADQYPYDASATGLISALVPRWAEEGGHEALIRRLENADTLGEIRQAMEENLARRGGADRIQFRYYNPDSTIEGETLQQVAEERGMSPLDMAIELIKSGDPGIVSFNMNSEDVHHFMRQPWTMTSSDGGLGTFGRGVPHPRNYGAFPRKIRKYVVEDRVVGLSFAVRSMTGLPARVFNLEDRGILHKGAKADLVIFDLDSLTDKAEFENPHQYSEGMVYVIVNGEYAIKEGEILDNRYGVVLRHEIVD